MKIRGGTMGRPRSSKILALKADRTKSEYKLRWTIARREVRSPNPPANYYTWISSPATWHWSSLFWRVFHDTPFFYFTSFLFSVISQTLFLSTCSHGRLQLRCYLFRCLLMLLTCLYFFKMNKKWHTSYNYCSWALQKIISCLARRHRIHSFICKFMGVCIIVYLFPSYIHSRVMYQFTVKKRFVIIRIVLGVITLITTCGAELAFVPSWDSTDV